MAKKKPSKKLAPRVAVRKSISKKVDLKKSEPVKPVIKRPAKSAAGSSQKSRPAHARDRFLQSALRSILLRRGSGSHATPTKAKAAKSSSKKVTSIAATKKSVPKATSLFAKPVVTKVKPEKKLTKEPAVKIAAASPKVKAAPKAKKLRISFGESKKSQRVHETQQTLFAPPATDQTVEPLYNTIRSGDCIAAMNAMPAESVDLVFADPPFNIGFDYDVYNDYQERNDYLEWSREWITAVWRVLKPNGTFWLAIGDDFAAELKIASQEIGFNYRSWVVWYYTFGVNCKNKFTRSHTHLFYFTKHPSEFTFLANDLNNRIPSARQLVYNDSRSNPAGRLPDDTWVLRPQDLQGCFTSEEDTWYFPRIAGTHKQREGYHGCQMPEQLLGRIIRLCSKENDLVLDPFSGSATTLAAAKKLGRRYLGFDLSTDYATRGNKRLDAIQVGAPLDGAPEPTMSAPATWLGKVRSDRIAGASVIPVITESPRDEAAPTIKLSEVSESTKFIEANSNSIGDTATEDCAIEDDKTELNDNLVSIQEKIEPESLPIHAPDLHTNDEAIATSLPLEREPAIEPIESIVAFPLPSSETSEIVGLNETEGSDDVDADTSFSPAEFESNDAEPAGGLAPLSFEENSADAQIADASDSENSVEFVAEVVPFAPIEEVSKSSLDDEKSEAPATFAEESYIRDAVKFELQNDLEVAEKMQTEDDSDLSGDDAELTLGEAADASNDDQLMLF